MVRGNIADRMIPTKKICEKSRNENGEVDFILVSALPLQGPKSESLKWNLTFVKK